MKTPQYEDKEILMAHVIEKDMINIPIYQRNLVWNMKRQEAFIRNVLEGEPFGIVLVKEKNKINEETGEIETTYDLVDGLQRISTLLKFHNTPLEYLKPSDIKMEKIDKLVREDLTLKEETKNEEDIKELKEKIQQKIFDCIKGGFEDFKIMRILRNEFGLSDDDNIEVIFKEIYKEFMEYIDIKGLNIRAINYKGALENIPNVFYHLNTGGVQLTKYDTYAALWNDTQFKVEDEELIGLVVDKYNKLQEESDLIVDFNEEALEDEGITLHEYCYALGGIIVGMDEYDDVRVLFGKKKKQTDPTGFELLALLLTENVNKADKLYPLLKDISPEFLVDLKEIIKQSLTEIRKTLRPLLVGMNQTSLNAGSDYQIYHMVVSYIKEYYDINLDTEVIKTNENSSLDKGDFEKYAPLHYFYDCITDFWNINRQVTDLNREIEDENRRHKYWTKIPGHVWEDALENKFMASQNSSRRLIWHKNKLFIDFLTKLKIRDNPHYERFFTTNDLAGNKYNLDFEHILPKKVILDHIKDLSESQQKVYNISPVGNLCYLTAKDNRSKKHKTLYEDTENRPSYVLNEDFMKCIVYPSREEIDITDYDNEEFRNAYNEFFKNRQKQLQNEFLELIKRY